MINFRLFTEQDIENLVAWVFEPHVLDVWDSAQGVEKKLVQDKYEKRLYDDYIETYIITIDEIDVGMIQTYFIDNHSDFSLIDEFAKGIDLFIGDPDYINKGFGTQVLRQFITEHVFNDPHVEYACIDPEVHNEPAVRVYEKVGFHTINVAYSTHSLLLTCYMLLNRDEYK